MLNYSNGTLKFAGGLLNPIPGVGPTPGPTIYHVTTSGTHGSVVANPNEGITGTEVTLSNTPDTHYHFDSYTLTGATLKNANQFDIANSDVSVVGNFLEDTKYTVTVNQSTGGTISASPVQGYTGTEVTLSNIPATHYTFGSYNLIGATLKSANKFDIANSNVTVGATWVEDTKYTVTCTNDGHGTIAASPTSNYSGSTVTLSSTPNIGYDFDSYTLISGTGASISGNTLTIGTSNVTVRGNFVQVTPPDEVQIGDQIWKTVNLAVNDGGTGIYTQTINYGQGNVTEYYYTWEAALRVAGNINGWHLPTNNEWITLSNTLGSTCGTQLKSTYGWNNNGNGTDDYNFAVFPAGYRSGSSYSGVNSQARFWTASESTSASNAGYIYFGSTWENFGYNIYLNKERGCLVRLIKDAT